MTATPAHPSGAPRARARDSLRFLGVRVDDVTADEAVAQVEAFVRDGRPHQVATVNPEFVMEARHNEAFRLALAAADLNVPDGVGLIWGSRLLRRPLRERVPGVELVERLAELCASRGYRLFLLGGFNGVAEATAAILKGRFPGLEIAGIFEGKPGDAEPPERVRAARPDILLVAYGHPKQDVWIHEHQQELRVPVAMGVGGAFDFIAGRTRRAPRWLRRLGLEWLHRLAREPWRWRRMLALPRFAVLVLRQRWMTS